MKKLSFFIAVTLSVMFSLTANGQSGVFDPNDPDVVFTSTNRPATPAWGVMAKWGHTNRLTWNGTRPFNYGYKSYYYKGAAFRVKFPKSYQHNVADGKKYPILIFLHGLGERGDVYDNEYQLLHGGLTHAQNVDNGTFDGFLFYMQSANGFHPAYFPMISELIDSMAKYVKLDVDRVVLSGLSSGGQGVWDFLGASTTYSKKFAAALPISAAQAEDKPTFSSFVTIPIWMSNGGLDNNPDPSAATDVYNYYKSLGGNIRQTFYPNSGHGVWNTFWAEPDYFPTLSTYHKANPLVYYGRSEFCPNDAVSVDLGLQAGFNAYEWQKNGVTIPGATSATLHVTTYGTYRARFKRTATSAWSDWSPSPVVIQQKTATITPPIQVDGLRSKVLPAPDGSTTVPITVPGNFTSYEWRRASDNALVSSSAVYEAPVGAYKLQVTEQYGCSSSFSDPFTIISAAGANGPDGVSNFAATTNSNSSIQLDWNDNPNPLNNETGFEIYRSTTTGTGYQLVAITGANVLTYLDQNLSPNTRYYYVMRAVNDNGASATTAEVTALTASDNQAPSAPANLTVTSSTRYSVGLRWDESTDDVGVTAYDVYVNGKKAYTSTGNTFTVYNLTQGQSYAFAVKARDGAGNLSPFSNQVIGSAIINGLAYKYYQGNWSNLPDFNTLTPVNTGTMPNVDITPRLQDDQFAFLWEGTIIIPTTGTYYFRTTSDDGSRLWLGSLNGATSPYSFSGTPVVNNDGLHGSQTVTSTARTLQAGVYPIAIAFFEQGGGQSMGVSWRTPSTGTSYVTIPNSAFNETPPVLTAPNAPADLTATSAGYDRINLSWTDNSNNETGFEIWRATSADGSYQTVGLAGANTTSFVDSNLAPNTTYYYRIRTVGLTGQSSFVPSNDAEANWKLNNNYADATGNGRAVTPNSSPTFSSTDKQEGTHAIDFNGSNQDLTITTSSGDYIRGGYSAKSIAMWIRSDVSNSNRGIIDLGGSDDGLALRLNANQLVAGIASNNTRRSISASYSSTGWNHIALVYSTNTLRLYVNGTQVASNTNLGFSSVTATSDASMIGDDNGTNALNTAFGQFDGRMDDIYIFGKALTAAEIGRIMNNTYDQTSATTAALPSAPAAPTGLTGNAPSTTSIQLNWTDNSANETGFEIWRSVADNANYRLLTTVSANTATYTDNGLFANVVYYYKVQAKGVGGNSAYSNEINVTTGNNNPVIAGVNNFTMRYASQRVVSLSATDADAEPVTLTVSGLPAFAAYASTGSGTGDITFSPAISDQGVYPIRVIAEDAHAGKDTLDFVLTVNDNYVPVIAPVSNTQVNENESVVLNLSATDTDGNASLVWSTANLPAFANLVSGANGAATLTLSPNFAQAGTYPVTLSVSDGAGGTGTTNFTITVVNVEPSTNKWYVNMQYNQLPGGASPWNNVNGLTAGNNLKDQSGATTPVSLQFMTTAWNAYSGGAVTNTNTGVYPDNVLRDYYYFGIFGAPETVDFRINGLDPAYKYNITLMAGSSWTGVADNGTTVFTINGDARPLYVQNNTQNTVTFTSLVPDANGRITVNMSKASGTPVGYLNAFVLEKVFDDGTTPVKPTGLAAANQADGSVKLTWTDVAYNELRYDVYRSATLNGTYTLLNPGANNNNTTTYTDNTVNGRTAYFYKIEAVNNYGGSGLTDAVTITTENKAPVVNAISNVYVKSGNATSVNIISSDDAGETLTAVVTNLPSFASFTDNGNGNGVISFTPGVSNLGVYKDITVRVTDNFGLTTERVFDLTVSDNSTRSIYVNLAGEFGTPEGKPWNNLVAYPFAGINLSNLKDDQDVTTPYSFQLVDGWTSSWQGGMVTGNNSGIYPDNVIKTSIYEGTTNAKRIRFTGLDVNKVYNIAVFSSNNAGIDASYTLVSGSQTLTANGRFNSLKTSQLNRIAPNASGVIEFSITKASTANYVFLNAVVLQEYDNTLSLVRPVELFTEINQPGKINLVWSDRSNNETGFEVWRSIAGGAYSLLTTTAANVSTFTDPSAATNTIYYYKVRAKNGAVFSDYSNTASGILGSGMVLINLNLATPQASPWNNTNNTPQVGAGIQNMVNSAGNNTGFNMEVTKDFGGYFDLGMTGGVLPDNVMLTSWWIEGGGEPASIRLSNLDQSKLYRVGFMGSSSWSGDFTASYTIGGRTVYLNAYQNKDKLVYIQNVRPNENGEINITLGTMSGTRWSFWSAIVLESYDDYSDVTDPGLGGGYVTGRSALPQEEPVVVTEPVTTEAANEASRQKQEELVLVDEVKVYPNPFTDNLLVSVSAAKTAIMSIQVVDMSGRVVHRRDLGMVMPGKYNVSLVSTETGITQPGTYLLQVIRNGKAVKTVKLVKLK